MPWASTSTVAAERRVRGALRHRRAFPARRRRGAGLGGGADLLELPHAANVSEAASAGTRNFKAGRIWDSFGQATGDGVDKRVCPQGRHAPGFLTPDRRGDRAEGALGDERTAAAARHGLRRAERFAHQARSTTLRVIVTAAPCVGVSVIFTVSASRWRRRSARFPRAVSATEKETLPADTDERTRRPTRTGVERRAAASDAPLASRSTSRRPPAPVIEMSSEPRTEEPRRGAVSFSEARDHRREDPFHARRRGDDRRCRRRRSRRCGGGRRRGRWRRFFGRRQGFEGAFRAVFS